MSDTDKPVLCPVCQRELETSAWLPCEGGHYESFDHYQCYGCGTVEKDFVDKVITRIAELELASAEQPDELETLKEFARDIMALAHDAMDLNGGDVEEIALKHGVLKSVEVFEPCSDDWCTCAEVADFPLYCNRTTELIAEPKESTP